MKNWLLVILVVVLLAASVTNGVLYFQQSRDLSDAREQLGLLQDDYAGLAGDVDDLGSSVAALDGSVSAIQGNVSSLQGDVSGLQSNVSSLGGDVAALGNDVSAVQGSVSTLQGDVAGVRGDISTIQGDVSAARSDISGLQGSYASLEEQIDGLAGSIANLQANSKAVMDAADKIAPSVVLVLVDLGDGWYSSGTGVIVTNTGWVLTAAHVLEDGVAVTIITNDGTDYDGINVTFHDSMDLGMVKIDSSSTNFPAAVLGSIDDVAVGQQVVAMGYPFFPEFIEPTVTAGIVSAIQLFGTYDLIDAFGDSDWLQFDAPVNYGNSGGPVIDLDGRVLGIVDLSFKEAYDLPWEGLNLAIPIDYATSFILETILGA